MWYYATDGKEQGPVSKEKVTELIREKRLGGKDLVWTTGMENWKKVSEVDEISPDPPPLGDGGAPPDLPSASNQTEGPHGSGATGDSGNDNPKPSEARSEESQLDGNEKYAGFGKRLLAYAIDNAIIFAFIFLASLVLILLGEANEVDFEAFTRGLGLFGGWLYFAILESSQKQATLGKQAMGLRVVDMDRNKIGFGRATGRYFGKIISGIILLIGFFMAAFTEKSQALHDIMASCLVVKDQS